MWPTDSTKPFPAEESLNPYRPGTIHGWITVEYGMEMVLILLKFIVENNPGGLKMANFLDDVNEILM